MKAREHRKGFAKAREFVERAVGDGLETLLKKCRRKFAILELTALSDGWRVTMSTGSTERDFVGLSKTSPSAALKAALKEWRDSFK